MLINYMSACLSRLGAQSINKISKLITHAQTNNSPHKDQSTEIVRKTN